MSNSGRSLKPAYAALWSLKWAFGGVGILSAFISILMLTGSLYMLQVYDRVLASRSIPTLIGISAIVMIAFVMHGVLDAVRSRMLSRIGAEFDRAVASSIFDLVRTLPLRGARPEQATQGVRDLDSVRGFLAGMGPTALFDMPFALLFVIICYFLHPWLGLMTIFGATMIIALTLWTEQRTKDETLSLTRVAAEQQVLVDASRRNAEALQAMGMGGTFRRRWDDVHQRFVGTQLAVADASSGIGSAARVFRMAFQSAVLGVGAYLVIQQQLTPGAMIAASILTSRALAPIETAIANWKGFVAARQALSRLNDMLRLRAQETARTTLPAPRKDFIVEDLTATAPGRQTPLIAGATLSLKAGDGLMIVGPSGGGKSTLIRALIGVWPALRGTVRLDGASLEHWDREQLGRHIGYMPQDIELFDGTVAENIARFQPNASDEDIVAAAKAAGAHDTILKLSDGYETRVGEGGAVLSGGQRQRVGLARALYREPFLVILDEPNSSLDTEGEAALLEAIAGVRARAGIAVIVTHKLAIAQTVNFVGRVVDGRLQVITQQEYRQNIARAAQQASQGPGASTLVTAGARQQVTLLRTVAGVASAARCLEE
ncbi:MAG: type I secretion system permease/ATPase [Beijerinckiaceae bacterium]